MNASTQPSSRLADAVAIVMRLREAGHAAYMAGGCVRDLLLGLEPKDFDVATDADPASVQSIFARTQAVGAAFGVVLVRQGKSTVEVATFRAEAGYDDGRHPTQVRFTSAEEDAQRRDFTINGLFWDPIEQRVIDFVGGQSDLRARRLRAIGDPTQRFDEDHLRLLRAVRFAARFELTIDPPTAQAIRSSAGKLARISPERIAAELRAMLSAPSRAVAWLLLRHFGLSEVIFRFVAQPGSAVAGNRDEEPSTDRNPFNPGDDSLVAHLPADHEIPFTLALAAAVVCYQLRRSASIAGLRQIIAPGSVRALVRTLRQALRLSNDELESVEQIIGSMGPLLTDTLPRVSVLKRFLALPSSGHTRLLLSSLSTFHVESKRIGWLSERWLELAGVDCAPPRLLDGDTLIASGFAPGPAFKKAIDAIYDAQLEGEVNSSEAAIELARSLLGK